MSKENFGDLKAMYDVAYEYLYVKIGDNAIPRCVIEKDTPDSIVQLWLNRLYILKKLIRNQWDEFDDQWKTDLPPEELEKLHPFEK